MLGVQILAIMKKMRKSKNSKTISSWWNNISEVDSPMKLSCLKVWGDVVFLLFDFIPGEELIIMKLRRGIQVPMPRCCCLCSLRLRMNTLLSPLTFRYTCCSSAYWCGTAQSLSLATCILILLSNQNSERRLSPVLMSGILFHLCAGTLVFSKPVAVASFLPVSLSRPKVRTSLAIQC